MDGSIKIGSKYKILETILNKKEEREQRVVGPMKSYGPWFYQDDKGFVYFPDGRFFPCGPDFPRPLRDLQEEIIYMV